MVMAYHWEDAAKRLERRADFFPNNRMLLHDSSFFRVQRPGRKKNHARASDYWGKNLMLLHDSSFFRVQRPGFKKNAFWHVNFPYVVKPTGDAEFVQVFFSKTEAFSQLLRICHQTLRVAIPQVLFRVHAPRQRKHHGPRLFIHVFLEPQESLDAAE